MHNKQCLQIIRYMCSSKHMVCSGLSFHHADKCLLFCTFLWTFPGLQIPQQSFPVSVFSEQLEQNSDVLKLHRCSYLLNILKWAYMAFAGHQTPGTTQATLGSLRWLTDTLINTIRAGTQWHKGWFILISPSQHHTATNYYHHSKRGTLWGYFLIPNPGGCILHHSRLNLKHVHVPY